ncbi:MAG TPA: cyclase family protein [Anaerolineae bacterium]|nr:cyclase family protein [Anaerolineae bacterium]
MGQKIIDLTMLLKEGMQTFAAHWHPFVEITQLARHGIENRETRKLTLGTHTGTHIDAPRHFIKDGGTVEFIGLDQLCGQATVVDFSELPDFSEIDVEMLKTAVGTSSYERLILRFDWDIKALGNSRYYSDHPFLSEEAAQWLVTQGCRLLAMDTPQPDNPQNGRNSDKDAPVHKILLGDEIVLVEYMVNLNALTAKEVYLVVAPLKIQEGDGAPARCFVIE